MNRSAFSRKTDTTELQKAPNCKFFYSFPCNDLHHFPTKKIRQISRRSAGRSKYGGRLLFAPGKEHRHEHKNARDPNHCIRFV